MGNHNKYSTGAIYKRSRAVSDSSITASSPQNTKQDSANCFNRFSMNNLMINPQDLFAGTQDSCKSPARLLQDNYKTFVFHESCVPAIRFCILFAMTASFIPLPFSGLLLLPLLLQYLIRMLCLRYIPIAYSRI